MEDINIDKLLKSKSYDFLRKNENLHDIILLTYGGSHAYGTADENSDIDLRGVALNSKEEILLGRDFKQVVDSNTDTTIYSFNKIIRLLTACNPNIIEMLGCRTEHYFILTTTGKMLLERPEIFLSKQCINTYGGFARNQFRRLQTMIEKLSQKYKKDTLLDATVDKLNKHMMHLVRLYQIAIDLLEEGEIYTYRYGDDLDLLLSIRKGEYTKDTAPTANFYKLVRELDIHFKLASKCHVLPEHPDYGKINELQMDVNELIVRGRAN